MLTARIPRAIGLTAVVTALSTVALAVPAQAVTPPVWPTAGHIPTGANCAISTSLGNPPNFDMRWTDTSTPAPRWEQAFSDDDGVTWEINWTMAFSRRP